MDSSDFTLRNVNQILKAGIAGQDLSFSHMLSCAMGDKLSVIAAYDPAKLGPDYYRLNSRGEAERCTDLSGYYYGMSPLLDSERILTALAEGQFSTLRGLDRFILAHHDCFMCRPGQREQLLHLARYGVLALASNYGIRVRSTPGLEALCRRLDPGGVILRFPGDGLLHVRGCPTGEMLAGLEGLRLRKDGALWTEAPDGEPFGAVCGQRENLRLDNGSVFYSGVLLRAVHLDKLPNAYENFRVDTLQISFERSTYATVFTLDGNFLDQPLLPEESRRAVARLLRRDDDCKRTLMARLDGLPETDCAADGLEITNQYLKACLNVNQIGVSGNVVTRDGILLLGKRSRVTIDGGGLYPGANGNAEVMDRNVSFYRSSVYEDCPSIRLDGARMDFAGEISREAYAELRLDCPTQDWHCCGLVLSGTRPDDEKPGRKASVPDYTPAQRRMHFNIIFQLDSSRTFPQLRESCTQAAESFENEQLRGVRLTCCRGPRELRQDRFFSLCRRVVDSRDLVESLLLIVLAFSGPGLGFSDGLSLIFALLVVLLTARRIWQAARELQRLRRAVTPMLLFQSDGAAQLKAQLDRLFLPGGKRLSFHPATYACLTLYLFRCHSGLSEKTP